MRALGVELARHGVTANAILPGWIKSDMTAGIMANEKFVANAPEDIIEGEKEKREEAEGRRVKILEALERLKGAA